VIKTYQMLQSEDPGVVVFDCTIAVDLEAVDAVYYVPDRRQSTIHLRGGEALYIYGAAAAAVLEDFQARGLETR
jgi:hypothetical protein